MDKCKKSLSLFSLLVFVSRIDTVRGHELIPLCPGVQEKVGALTIDQAHDPDQSEILIELLVVDMTKQDDSEEEQSRATTTKK